MDKRGQIAIFIIVAAVLLVVFGFFYFFMIKPGDLTVKNEDISSIKTYVQLCLEKSIKDGLVYAGRNGGYIYFPDNTQWLKVDPDTNIVILYNNGANRLPRLSEIERQMDIYLKERMIYCTDFSGFREQGYEIEEGRVVDANTSIFDNYTMAVIDYPLTIKKDGSVYELNRFAANAEVPFGRVYDTVNRTINDIALSDALYNHEFDEKLAPHLDGNPLYSLRFILNSYPLDVRYEFVTEQTTVWSVSTDDWEGGDYMYNFAAVHSMRRAEN